MPKKILVVAAHPDDETLGAGGAMALHCTRNDSVSVIILGTGIASRKEKGTSISGELSALRAQSKSALAKLGVKDVQFLDFPDNSFDSVPLLEITKAVEKIVSEKTPGLVYTHHWGDLNIDHRRTFEAVMTACRPVGGCSVEKILCFEVLSSTEWNAQRSETAFAPNCFIDISSTLQKKLDGLSEYIGEVRPFPHPRSLEAVSALAKLRGSTIGVAAAEAFEIAREIL